MFQAPFPTSFSLRIVIAIPGKNVTREYNPVRDGLMNVNTALIIILANTTHQNLSSLALPSKSTYLYQNYLYAFNI